MLTGVPLVLDARVDLGLLLLQVLLRLRELLLVDAQVVRELHVLARQRGDLGLELLLLRILLERHLLEPMMVLTFSLTFGDFWVNFERLVLGCIETKVCK